MDLSQEDLYIKYPKIFIQHTWTMKQTCMCWGLDIDKGWYPIVNKLCEDIQKYVDETRAVQVEATSVKEKFGTLRFQVNYYDEYVSKLIFEAARLSELTCSKCSIIMDQDSSCEEDANAEEDSYSYDVRCKSCKNQD